MSLSQFSFRSLTIQGLHSWFVDIWNHLKGENYSNGDWTPTITGMTGSPTVTAYYQRFGKICNFAIILAGTHTMSDAEITLPKTATDYGVATMHSLTDNSTIGTAVIDSVAQRLKIKTYWVTDETIVIHGVYKVAGI